MGTLIDKGKVVYKICDLFLDKYEAKANSDLTEFYKEVLKILINEKSQSNWISVNDRLPAENEPVFVYSKKRCHRFQVDVRQDGHWIRSELVTHWLPIPEPPKIVEDTE